MQIADEGGDLEDGGKASNANRVCCTACDGKETGCPEVMETAESTDDECMKDEEESALWSEVASWNILGRPVEVFLHKAPAQTKELRLIGDNFLSCLFFPPIFVVSFLLFQSMRFPLESKESFVWLAAAAVTYTLTAAAGLLVIMSVILPFFKNIQFSFAEQTGLSSWLIVNWWVALVGLVPSILFLSEFLVGCFAGMLERLCYVCASAKELQEAGWEWVGGTRCVSCKCLVESEWRGFAAPAKEGDEPEVVSVRLVKVNGSYRKFADAPSFVLRGSKAGGLRGGICSVLLRVWNLLFLGFRAGFVLFRFIYSAVCCFFFCGFCCLAGGFKFRENWKWWTNHRAYAMVLLVMCVLDFVSDVLVGVNLVTTDSVRAFGAVILTLSSADIASLVLVMLNVKEGGDPARWVHWSGFFLSLLEMVIFGLNLWALSMKMAEEYSWNFAFSLSTTVLASLFKGVMALLASPQAEADKRKRSAERHETGPGQYVSQATVPSDSQSYCQEDQPDRVELRHHAESQSPPEVGGGELSPLQRRSSRDCKSVSPGPDTCEGGGEKRRLDSNEKEHREHTGVVETFQRDRQSYSKSFSLSVRPSICFDEEIPDSELDSAIEEESHQKWH